MHVGFFTDSYLPRTSGVVHAVESSALQLRARGHRVSIVAPAYPGHVDQDPDVVRVPSVTAPGDPEFRLALPYPSASLRTVRGLGVDLVHTHSPFLLGGMGWWVARALGRPVVFTYHTRYEEYAHYTPVVGDLARPFVSAYTTVYCNRCDRVLASLPSIAALLRDAGVRARIAVVPSTGIDVAAFARAGGGAGARSRFAIPASAPLLVFVGRLAKEKNVALLIATLQTLPADARLLLVGDGPERPALEAQVRGAGLAGRVAFAGTQPPPVVAEVLAAADLFVFPSTTETFGIAMIEAMAAGCAVVAVRAAASSDLVRDGETGRLVPPDPTTFAGAVQDLLAQPDRRSAMGAAARAAAADYDSTRVTDRLLIVYRELLGHHGAGGATCA